MARGLAAAQPGMVQEIQAAIKAYVRDGATEGNNPDALANALGAAIGDAVHKYVKQAKVQADLQTMAINFIAPLTGGPCVFAQPGPILTKTGGGKLS